MAETTGIEWTDATWQIVTGCSIKSPGCNNCYAMRLAGSRLRNHPSRVGLTHKVKGKSVWTGEVRFNEQWLDQPLRWKKPHDIFVAAHGDIGHDGVIDEMLDQIFAVMFMAPHHRYQVLTKRPDRLLTYLSQGRPLYERVLRVANRLRRQYPHLRLGDVPVDDPALGAFHRNILIGTSVERQQEADERRPHLEALARMGWNTWVSYEPALGPVDWPGWEFIKWMVSGNESGPESRPGHPQWHRDTRDWCESNGIPFFYKQTGDWADYAQLPERANSWERTGDGKGRVFWQTYHPEMSRTDLYGGRSFETKWPFCSEPDSWPCMVRVGKKLAGALLDGVAHKEMPR